MQTVINFFQCRKGRARGFRFKDSADSRRSSSLGSGRRPTDPAAPETYADASTSSEVRIIKKPCDNGTLSITMDGSPFSPANYTVDYTTGIVTVTGGVTGDLTLHAWAWSGQFDVPVRFDSDRLTVVQDSVGRRHIESLPVVELLI